MNGVRHSFIKLSTFSRTQKKPLTLLRPLVYISRFQCVQFCEFWNLPIQPDSTNSKIFYKRNRLRLQCLPYIKYFFNKKLFLKIAKTQQIIYLENEYFNLIIKKLISKNKNHIGFTKLNHFIYFPKLFQYRILHNFFILFKIKISFSEIDLLIKLF